jgi:preprotein translocase subunit SecA
MLAGTSLSSAEPTADSTLLEDRRDDVPAAPVAAATPAAPAEEAPTTELHPTFRAKGLEQPVRRPQQLQYSAPSETGEAEQRSVGSVDDELSIEQLQGASRNGPCPCGSGKKFKMCHGKG